MTDESTPISRRTFVRDGATAAAAFAMAPMIVPRHVLGGVGYRAPSRTLNVAMIGFGGMGMSNMNALLQAGENIVAVCDIDYPYVERSIAGRLRPRQGQTTAPAEGLKIQEAYTKAKKYDDFRTMFDKQKDIDAVVIATPDHLHAIAAYHAMKAGKHVYVQKPLTYTVQEARLLARTAHDMKIVSQMGNQGHSMEGTRRMNEIIAAGVLGPIREVHMWTDRPARYWAQGIPRPGTPVPTPATPPDPSVPPRWSMRTVDNAVLKAMEADPQTPPPGVKWDLFLGPTTRQIPYHHQKLSRGDETRGMGTSLFGKTLGIAGLGAIGRELAIRAVGLKMRVIASDPQPDRKFAADHHIDLLSLDELLRQSDFLSLHVRLDDQTRNMIGARELGLMKRNAYLINAARRELVDEEALVVAILAAQIAGAALDDPPGPAAKKLLGLPNVVFTPHLGNRAIEGVHGVFRSALEAAIQVLGGQRPTRIVNPQVYEHGLRPLLKS